MPFRILDEIENRHHRRTNLIVRGLPEAQTGSLTERKDHDEAKINKMLQSIAKDESVTAKRVTRIGNLRPDGLRLIKITVDDEDTKRSLLRASRYLKASSEFRNVYLSPDLTPMQQHDQKELQRQLKARRDAGDNVVIRSGRIQPRTRAQNFP